MYGIAKVQNTEGDVIWEMMNMKKDGIVRENAFKTEERFRYTVFYPDFLRDSMHCFFCEEQIKGGRVRLFLCPKKSFKTHYAYCCGECFRQLRQRACFGGGLSRTEKMALEDL